MMSQTAKLSSDYSLEDGETREALATPLLASEGATVPPVQVPVGHHSTSVQRRFQPVEAKGLSSLDIGLAMLGVNLNSGIFSIPKSFSSAGLVLGLLALLVVPALCILTAQQLGRTFAELKRRQLPASYEGAGQAIGGRALASFMQCLSLIQLLLFVIIMLVSLNQILQKSLGLSWSTVSIVVGSCSLCTLQAAIADSIQAKACSTGAIAFLVACATTVVTGWELPAPASSLELTGSLSKAPLLMTLVTFTVANHPVLPVFFTNAKSPRSFDRGCMLAWTAWPVLALLLCLFCSTIFGQSLQDVMLNNIGRDLNLQLLPNGESIAAIMSFWVLLRLQTGMTLLTRAHTELFARRCGIALKADRSGWREIVLAAPVFVFAGALAVFFSEAIVAMEDMCGALIMGITSFIFPAAAFLSLCKPASRLEKVGAYIAIIFGIVIFFAPVWSAWL